MWAFGREAWVWQPMQPFVAKRSAPRALVGLDAGGRSEELPIAAELAGCPVAGARLAAVSSAAKVP